MITITSISVKMYVIGVPFHVGGNVNIKLDHYLGFLPFYRSNSYEYYIKVKHKVKI